MDAIAQIQELEYRIKELECDLLRRNPNVVHLYGRTYLRPLKTTRLLMTSYKSAADQLQDP